MSIGHVHQCSFTRPFSLPLGLGFPWEWKSKSLSPVWLCYPMDCVAWPAPPGMAFSRQEYWSGLPFPSPGDLSYPGIEPRAPASQADSFSTKPRQHSNRWASGLLTCHAACIFISSYLSKNVIISRLQMCSYALTVLQASYRWYVLMGKLIGMFNDTVDTVNAIFHCITGNTEKQKILTTFIVININFWYIELVSIF